MLRGSPQEVPHKRSRGVIVDLAADRFEDVGTGHHLAKPDQRAGEI